MFIVVLIIIVAAYEIRKIIKSGQSKKALGIYIALVSTSLVIAVLLSSDKSPVNPSEVISSVLRAIGWEGTTE